jgi:glucose/arabinose dehydrogenase
MRRKWFAAGLAACVWALAPATRNDAQQMGQSQLHRLVGHLAKPARRNFSEELLGLLWAPDGFEINIFARGLGNPRMLAVGRDGAVYVTRREQNDVIVLVDRDDDGRSDSTRTVLPNLKGAHGIAVNNDQLYICTDTKLYRAELRSDRSVGTPQLLIERLPDGGQHPNRTLGFGPDGMLYISVGSSCNACDESNEEHATMLRVRPDGSQRAIYARGLRNTIGFAWHPQTRELWGMDNGSDWRGDDTPPEELNRIVEGGDYGWPFCYGDRVVDRYLNAEPKGMTREQYCARTRPPVLSYEAHSAPLNLVFYTAGQFPAEYRNDAFVTMRGSWNRLPPVGYKIVRIRFQNGRPERVEDFLTGFLFDEGQSYFGRPAGMAIARDGSLLFSDDTNGVIYRIAYREARARR